MFSKFLKSFSSGALRKRESGLSDEPLAKIILRSRQPLDDPWAIFFENNNISRRKKVIALVCI